MSENRAATDWQLRGIRLATTSQRSRNRIATAQSIVAPDASRPALYREIYLGLAQYPNGILGKLFYNADRFTPAGMETFISHFRKIVREIAADPDAKLRDLIGTARDP